jgi:hypothetical protein
VKRFFDEHLIAVFQLLFFIFLWVLAFIFGVHVNTRVIRDNFSLNGYISFWELLVLLFCWTWSNLLILCCISAIIGELGHGFFLSGVRLTNYRGAIVKGFFIYLLALTGQLVIIGTVSMPARESQDPTMLYQASYFRLSSFVSLVSFLVGYSPRLFIQMIERFEHLTEGTKPEK